MREDTPVFTANFNINTGSRKSLAVDVTAGQRVTFDGQLTSKTANVQFFWDRDEDLSRAEEISRPAERHWWQCPVEMRRPAGHLSVSTWTKLAKICKSSSMQWSGD